MEIKVDRSKMNEEETIGDLVITWSDAFEKGHDLSVHELCVQHPEFANEVAARIESLRAMRWLMEESSLDDDPTCPFPRSIAELVDREDADQLPETSFTLDELVDSIAASGLRSAQSIVATRHSFHEECPREFVKLLIHENLLTQYQAKTFLTGSDVPIVLDEYEILERIGAGGMGIVYRALHRTMDRVIAVKILPREMVDSRKKVLRFQREVKASAKLQHPNIVATYDARQSDGIHFLVLEYVDGKNLAEVVQIHGPLTVSRSVNLILQAAHGLMHAHAQGIIHRDVKPENLILDESGVLKVLDMGLAKMRSGDADIDVATHHNLTEAGAVMGTVNYMSPEQALDSVEADHRSDVYSLGCTLFYLLTERLVYSANTPMKIAMAHQQAAIPSLNEFRNDVPVELDRIYSKMLAKRPEDRFQDLSEVIDALVSLEIQDCDSSMNFKRNEEQLALSETQPAETTTQNQQRTAKISNGDVGSNRQAAANPSRIVRLGFLILAGGIAAGFILHLKTRWGELRVEYQESQKQEGTVSTDDDMNSKKSESDIDTERENSETNREHSNTEEYSESEIAKWVLVQGGQVRVESTNGKSDFVTSAEMLPPGPLLIRSIFIDTTDTKIADDDVRRFRSLKGLQLLNLNHQELSESSIDIIVNLPPLKQLSLLTCEVTDQGLQKIVAAHPDLINLGIGDCPVTESGLAQILKLKQLRELFLITLPISYSSLEQFKSMESLDLLYVAWTHLDDEGLEELSKWSNLKRLGIKGTKVTAEGIRRFQAERPDCVLIAYD